MTTERKQINWRDVLGNPYKRRIHPLMLSQNGLTMSLKVGIRGESKYSDCSQSVLVLYDRSYVVSKLAKAIEPLKGLPWNEIQSIVSEAFRECKKDD